MAAMTISRGLLTCRRAAGPRLVAQNSVRPPDPVGLHTMIARPAPRGTPETVFDSDTVVTAVKRLAGPYRLAPPVRRLPGRIELPALPLRQDGNRWQSDQ